MLQKMSLTKSFTWETYDFKYSADQIIINFFFDENFMTKYIYLFIWIENNFIIENMIYMNHIGGKEPVNVHKLINI